MTVRTKSRSGQWTVWLCASLAILAVYVVLSRIFFNSVAWDLFDPNLHQLAVPLLVLLFIVTWNTRWDGVKREKKAEGEKPKVEGEKTETASGQARQAAVSTGNASVRSSISTLDVDSAPVFPQYQPQPPPQPQPSTSSLSGEALFAQARELPHQPIPDFDVDGEYLELLGKSAAAGHSPALAKLGEYAMRRAAWVEAYYWMKQAKRNGMHGLSPTLREIRMNWAEAGFPDQSSNVNRLFSREAGSIGRALLHLDSGHMAATAREFLKEHHPEVMI